MLFHAFDCLSLPLLRCTELHCTFPFHHVLFHFHAIPFLNCTVLGYSMHFCAMPSLRSAHLASLNPAISLQYNQLCSFPYNSTANQRFATHCQSFTSLYINVLNCVNPLRINTLLLFAVPMPYNSIRYLSRCFSVLDLEFNYR